VSGTTNPGGVVVNSTAFVSSSTLVANVTVADTADIALFDIVVDNPDGREGHGTELFSVIAKTSQVACAVQPLPARLTELTALNTVNGSNTPAYTGGFGKTLRTRVITLGGNQMVMTAVGTITTQRVEIFFLDPVSGAVLDGTLIGGTFTQPHVSVAVPATRTDNLTIGDFNGDGVPDLAVSSYDIGAWAYLGQINAGGVLSFSAAIPLTPGAGQAAGTYGPIASADLDGSTGDEIAVGASAKGKGPKAVPGKIFLFHFSGSTATNYRTIVDPDPMAGSVTNFPANIAIGDVTGDATRDLVAGAWGIDRVYVFPGPSFSAPFIINNGVDFGRKVRTGRITSATALFEELLAFNGAGGNDRRASVFPGPLSSTSTPTLVFRPEPDLGAGFAISGSDLGDLDGDGLADVLIGAPNTGLASNTSCTDIGVSYLFLSSEGFARYRLMPPSLQDGPINYGWDVAAVGGTRLFLVSEKSRNAGSVIEAGQVRVYKVN
jgi:hypothetical protein